MTAEAWISVAFGTLGTLIGLSAVVLAYLTLVIMRREYESRRGLSKSSTGPPCHPQLNDTNLTPAHAVVTPTPLPEVHHYHHYSTPLRTDYPNLRKLNLAKDDHFDE